MRAARFILLLTSLCASESARADVGSLDPADADLREPLPSSPTSSPFWRDLVRPEEARADRLVRQGRALLVPALGLGFLLGGDLATQRRLAIEAALARFARALTLVPAQREARLFYGKALSFWEDRTPDGQLVSRSAEAIEQLELLRTEDPAYEAQEVAFQLGLLYTRQLDFARAVAEYRRALALRSDDDADTTLLGNLAEVTMLSGDLPGSLALYQRAAAQGEGGARLLALWGSAVALDRLGEPHAALVQARRALEEDRAPLAVLHQAGVFFVPPHERHYYEGLGALALSEREREDDEPLAGLLRSGARALAKPDSGAVLTQFERVLAELAQGDSRAATAALRARTARARAVLQTAPARTDAQLTRAGASGPSSAESAPSARDTRALLWLLRSLAAFELYLQRDGGGGPFAEDARRHLRELTQSLPRE